MRIAESLRDAVPTLGIELNLGDGSFKAQMKRADRSGADYALILGESELAASAIGLKPLRSTDEQVAVAFDELADVLAQKLGTK